ncbi:hypothetical protein SAMD00019534_057770 [Acytostelium subglobosum LB1]|uniref:hypothetical protein n=1 Tax=Acytostelium subglobosum LB1 TaxID=1410327 RepID=UPI000644DBEE|nr:hypothetical protein SAMD00019534_057770 [Acytostelium subglobosum LB1]GAM22602.1 hypothetical protein SAMD00019534_057770 [Acytostelium subglobosum LB1]|eukprot:XP_012754722.1 hypothetical protein SAMD00019534_057770 [Acytostelium subglobosum LB1]
MMDKYVKVPRVDNNKVEPNEIRLSYTRKVSPAIEHGLNLFAKGENTVFMKAVGSSTIPKAILVTEMIKRRVAGIHQVTEVGTEDIVTKYLPKEEGLDIVEMRKQTPFIRITLSKIQPDTTQLGYQPPQPESMVQPRDAKPKTTSTTTTTTDNSGGSSSSSGDQQEVQHHNGGARGSGYRGRGRGGRGRGRGGRGRGGRGGRNFNSNDGNNNNNENDDGDVTMDKQQTEGGNRGSHRGGQSRGGSRGGRGGRGGRRGGLKRRSMDRNGDDTSMSEGQSN